MTDPYSLSVPDPHSQRAEMVRAQIEARGVRDPAVLAAMRTVPRHEFVEPEHRAQSYADKPLPIGHGQTISQPYIVALMTELCELKGGETVLEIGTGCGYQAAVLAEIAGRVFTIEIVAPLAQRAQETLQRLHYGNVSCRCGDGSNGWPEAAPFDAILVAAAPPKIPRPLLEQLADGGRLVAPIGTGKQALEIVRRKGGKFKRRRGAAVRFVPLVGEAGQ